MKRDRRPPVGWPLPLRLRLTGEILGAIAVLVVGFATATLVAISLHLYRDAQRDARATATNVMPAAGIVHVSLIKSYVRVSDPWVWVMHGASVVDRSPNSPPKPIAPGQQGLLWHPAAVFQSVAEKGPLTVIVDWPVSSDWGLFQSLLWEVAGLTAVGALMGALIARWTTRRVLAPVTVMADGVTTMLQRQAPEMIPVPAGDDEFTNLAVLLNRLLGQLNQRWQRDRELMADAAHQLRTPIEVIRGNLDIVRTWEELDQRTRDDCLDAIDRTVSEISQLVADLLTLERAEGPVPPLLCPLDLGGLIRGAAEDARLLAKGDTTVTCVAPGAQRAMEVQADAEMARRALWAVVENALHYTPTEGGQIRLELVESSDLRLRGVRIADNGPGIPDKELPKVFTRFYRGSQVRDIPGTGLGLSIARALMESQQGSVELQSSAKGTVVTLWFTTAPRWEGDVARGSGPGGVPSPSGASL